MKILVLNGSPHPQGNTAAMVDAFIRGAKDAGNQIDVFSVCHMKIAGCLGCEYCHTKGNGNCIQEDDMQKIYPHFEQADMIVLASPVYYLHISGQLQCAITRTYNIGIPKNLKKAALILSSGADDVYDGAIYSYHYGFIEYMKLQDLGVFTAYGEQNKSTEKLDELYRFGRSLTA